MRRKDREVTDAAEILDIISRCEECRLALSVDNLPYIVPLNFGYTFEDGRLTLYFHSANEGRKLDMLRENPNACVQMDCSLRVIIGDTPGKYTMQYESVVCFGELLICTHSDEKRDGLLALIRQYAPEHDYTVTERDLREVTVFKLNVSSFTGKRHISR